MSSPYATMLPRFSFFPCTISIINNYFVILFSLSLSLMNSRFKNISIDPPPSPLTEMEFQEDNENEEFLALILKPSEWFTRLVSLQADIIYNCIVNLSSPICSLFSVASDSYQRAEQTATSVELAVQKVPSKLTHGSSIMLKKICFGVLGAIQVCMLMMFLLVLAAVLGAGLVQLWLEEPVFVRDRLFFDYTDANPQAIFPVAGVRLAEGKSQNGVPVGHTYHVSLLLLMPESAYNRDIGVFQLSAEILSNNGNVIAKSSQPCMLRFSSLPVRLIRTFLMGIPLLLGISDETQKITIKILKHKEGNERTGAIRFTLSPRAGTSTPPQLYEAEILLNSHLPWSKQLVHNWKWTFYVWTSTYIYILLLIILISCCKQVLFPLTVDTFRDQEPDSSETNLTPEELRKLQRWTRYEKEIPESLRRWQLRRRKRKAIYLHEVVPSSQTSAASSASSYLHVVVPSPKTSAASSASGVKITREDTTSTIVEEEIGDSESVCLGGRVH